jgi:hypothetical protein
MTAAVQGFNERVGGDGNITRVGEDLIRMIARLRKRCRASLATALQDASEELKVHVFDGRFEVDSTPSSEPFRKLIWTMNEVVRLFREIVGAD